MLADAQRPLLPNNVVARNYRPAVTASTGRCWMRIFPSVGWLAEPMAVQRKKKRRGLPDALALLLFVILLPLIAVAIALYLAFCLLQGGFLNVVAWRCWCAHGRYVLFVYSDSPIWHDYIKEHILPRLGERAVILNWSQRSQWKRTLAVMTFRYFGGSREFNPMAVVFRPFRLAR